MAIVLCRTVIVFATLLLLMRLLGKRQLGELEISELVVSVLIADIGALPLQDIGIPLLNALVPIITLFCLELLLSWLTLRSVKLRGIIWGKPCFLIEKGKINQREMRRNRFSLDELTEELRRQSITDLNTVEYAVLEVDGTLNVLLIPPCRPVTAAQMKVETSSSGYPYMIITQGRVMEHNLIRSGHDRQWLREELARQGVTRADEIYLMTVNNAGQVYCAKKELT